MSLSILGHHQVFKLC